MTINNAKTLCTKYHYCYIANICLSKIKVVFLTGSDRVNINVDRMANNDDSVNGNVSSYDSSVSGLDRFYYVYGFSW